MTEPCKCGHSRASHGELVGEGGRTGCRVCGCRLFVPETGPDRETVYVRYVRQQYSDDCGVACLAMIAGVEYEDAIGALGAHNWQQKIVTSQMPYFLGALGIAVREVYPDCGELSGLRLMCVRGHYVVVLPDNTVHDPARGPSRPLSSPEYAEPFQTWECHRVAEVDPDFLAHRCVPRCDRCHEAAHDAYLESRE